MFTILILVSATFAFLALIGLGVVIGPPMLVAAIRRGVRARRGR